MPKSNKPLVEWPLFYSPAEVAEALQRDQILLESLAEEDILMVALWLDGLPDFEAIESTKVAPLIANRLRQLADSLSPTRSSN